MASKRNEGTYFLARVTLHGKLKEKGLESALAGSAIIQVGKYLWTVTDSSPGALADGTSYVFGFLTKYRSQGQVEVVDAERKRVEARVASDLVEAKSPFMYIPSRAAIAHCLVWNKIDDKAFRDRLHDLIMSRDWFFADLQIEAIANLDSFVLMASKIEKVTEVEAKVFPSNPLWGPLWRKLRKYISDRKLGEISISERAAAGDSIRSDLVGVVQKSPAGEVAEGAESLDSVADQAVLMAAAGYGKGKIVGMSGDVVVTVKTSQVVASFMYSKIPSPDGLAARVVQELNLVEKKTGLSHR